MPFDSTIKRAERVLEIVAAHYEPGRQDRCLKWVWRNKVRPELGLTYGGFQKILHRNGFYVNERRPKPTASQQAEIDRRQMKMPIWEEDV